MTTLRQHLAYARYVVRHKLFVLRARRFTGCSLWRAIVHDLSKLRPSEWGPYARTFYAPDGAPWYREYEAFDRAWLLHQHRNPHHWQHWVLRGDDGSTQALRMPQECVSEMLADWLGAGQAQGHPEVWSWYRENRSKMVLHPATRAEVEFGIEAIERELRFDP